jgi:hypothetical protein
MAAILFQGFHRFGRGGSDGSALPAAAGALAGFALEA